MSHSQVSVGYRGAVVSIDWRINQVPIQCRLDLNLFAPYFSWTNLQSSLYLKRARLASRNHTTNKFKSTLLCSGTCFIFTGLRRTGQYLPIPQHIACNVFELRTDTGSELFSYFTCLHTTTFIFLSLFALVETITLKIWERPMSWPAKCSLPGAVRG